MSKYLKDKLFNICYRHIFNKYETHELTNEQLKEVNYLKNQYEKKSLDLISKNPKEYFETIPTKKEYEQKCYKLAIDLIAKDIVEHKI